MTTTVNQLLKANKSNSDTLCFVTPDTLVIDAIRKMSEEQVGALLVLENKKLAGIMSERDYTRKVILNNRSSKETNVSEIMTPAASIKSVTPAQTVEECLVIMSGNHIRHLPVIEDDRPVGVLSVMDVVKNIISEKESLIEQLEHYITDTAY